MSKTVTKYVGFIETYMGSRDPEAIILAVELEETDKQLKLPRGPIFRDQTPNERLAERVRRTVGYKTLFRKDKANPFCDTWNEAFQRLMAKRTLAVTQAERALELAKYNLSLVLKLEKPDDTE